jgi:hypothetical protein
MEINNKHFEVEKQLGNDWVNIGMVKGNGNSQAYHAYQFTDKDAFSNNNTAYYRLKIVDFEGNAEFSKTVKASIENEMSNELLVQPNPFKESLKIALNTGEEIRATATLYNLNGKTLVSKELYFSSEINEVDWNGLDELQEGCYILIVQFGDHSLAKKVFKH